MNAGKSTALLQASYNYQERGMQTLLFAPTIDDRHKLGCISSRIGLNAEANLFTLKDDLLEYVEVYLRQRQELKCVLVDEAQFLTKKQVLQLTKIVDRLNIPVLCYGLRSDFRAEPFEGSLYLLIWADELNEIKTVCYCGRKAIMNIRFDAENHKITKGLAAQLFFCKNIQNENTDKKVQFRQHMVTEIENNKIVNESNFDSDKALLDLFGLLCFIHVWSDFKETWEEDSNCSAERQQMKFKKDINKSKRKLIHAGLFKSVYEILLQFNLEEEAAGEVEIEQLLKELEQYAERKKTLMNVTEKFLKIKKFKPSAENIEKNFLTASKAISAFSLWPDKLFYGCSFGIGLIAALACGLSTGGAIFVLLAGFSLPLGLVITLSLLIFLAGTRANFQLFSQHIPQFFKELRKTGGMTEFIDQQGKRLQLSKNKKFLLLPAGLVSVSVGAVAAAITYLEGTKMLALICPMLLSTCPHLIIALLSILAGALLIGLTIVMLRTFVGVLQSQFSWQKIKQNVGEKWQNLNFIKCLDYVVRVLVMAAALFGLGYLYLTGTPTLAGLLGWVAADIITLAAILGDLPFTLMTALAWYNSLFKNNANPHSAVPKNISYYVYKIIGFLALIINAFGNAALVFTDSCASRIASIAAFMNSYASNRIQEDDSLRTQARIMATEKSLFSLKATFFEPSAKTPQLEALNDEELLNNKGSDMRLGITAI
ncbi:hypothetical protein FQR65_LT14138 [Abscondita terminalis]|nr:hypothetical protein FQR65_LT14138 [Abscondita terminalis]